MKNSSPLRWILLAIALLVPALGAGTILIRHAIRRRRQVQAVSTEHNVQSPKNEHSPYSLGISKFREMVRQYQSQTLLDYATRLFHQLGDTYVSRVVGMDVVFTRDPDNIKHILQRRFDDFEIGPLRRHLFAAVNPDGIFGFDGGEWRSRRKLFRVHFADTRAVVDLDTVESHVQLLIQRIPADGGSVDIQQLFVALMTDVLGTLAGGESIHALSEERTDDEKELDGALTFVKDNIAKMGMSRPSSLLSDTLGFRRSGAIIRKYMEKLVCKAARENAEQAKLGETSEKAYRRSFIHGSVYDEHSLSMVRDQAASIYLAGIESVAALLSAAFRFLAQDERVFQNLRGVILDRFGADARPEYDELTSIPYLRHVLNESLRLVPPVPFNAKIADKDTWLPRGGGPDGTGSILVRKGQIVSFWSWSAHRKAEIFGADVDTFRPERWEHIKEDTAGFIPFQPGQRVCPGQRIAMTSASYIVIRILQHYASLESRDIHPWTERHGLGLLSTHGVHVTLSTGSGSTQTASIRETGE